MRSLKTAVTVAVLGLALTAAVIILYPKFQQQPPSMELANSDSADTTTTSEDSTKASSKPLSAEDKLSMAQQSLSENDSAGSTGLLSNFVTQDEEPLREFPELSAYDVGRTDISEEVYIELVERLKHDPVLMNSLLDELRSETDASRVKRLVSLLGATGSSEVLPVAEELIYSSDTGSRKSGLDLLSRVAPLNPAAFDIANSILSSEADPDILVSTMNVLALPDGAQPEARASAISQIMPLASHDTPAVRRHSVSMLVRLTNDETLSPVLYGALSDSDASVRQAAVYAYAQYPFQTTEAIERLFEIAEDSSESKGTRRAAIITLSGMEPDEQAKGRISAAKKTIR